MKTDSFITPTGDHRLTEIETHLSRLFQSGQPGHDEFLRYYGAAFRYFRVLVGDGETAKDLTNQFAERFFNGDFTRFDPAKGRFRDFVKTAIRNMAIDHHRRRRPMAEIGDAEVAAPDETDATFDAAWHEELLHQAWRALERRQEADGQPHFAVLKLKTDHPKMRSTELGENLSKTLGKLVAAATARQWVHRARDLFQDLLIDEVAYSIGSKDRGRLMEELESLRLLTVCRPAMERRFGSG